MVIIAKQNHKQYFCPTNSFDGRKKQDVWPNHLRDLTWLGAKYVWYVVSVVKYYSSGGVSTSVVIIPPLDSPASHNRERHRYSRARWAGFRFGPNSLTWGGGQHFFLHLSFFFSAGMNSMNWDKHKLGGDVRLSFMIVCGRILIHPQFRSRKFPWQ